MKEVWRDIKGYEGLYQVSNLGRVKSLERLVWGGKVFYKTKERILKPSTTDYMRVSLYKNAKGKNKMIQVLVAEAFIDNPNNYLYVNHKDESKQNNMVDNLEYCTHQYNDNYGTRNERISKKLSKRVKCLETNAIYNSVKEVFLKTGIRNVDKVCTGKRKTAGGYHWKYI